MKFAFIEKERGQFPIPMMCRLLSVSRSGYYAWRHRGPDPRRLARTEVARAVQEVFEASRKTYGSPRIHAELRSQGRHHSRRHIAFLMRRSGLRARAARRRRPRSEPSRQIATRNVLERRFAIRPINEVWVADLTYVPTAQGWLYLAVLLDLGSRRVVGWGMSPRLTSDLTLSALDMALQQRRPPPGVLHHSDRGQQYSCNAYLDRLEQHGLQPSFSRIGDCWDNAVAESFFHTLKVERLHGRQYTTRREAQADLFEFIEVWYNRKRRHSTLGYSSPAEFERRL